MVFCWIVLQVSSRLFKVTHLSHAMCLVLSATLDTDTIILQYSTSFLYYTVRILKFMNVLLSMMSEKQWTPFYSDLDLTCFRLIWPVWMGHINCWSKFKADLNPRGYSLRSKRFHLVSEQGKTSFGRPRNEPTPSPLFYLRHFSRVLWLSFLVLCS